MVQVDRRMYCFQESEPDSRPPPVSFSPPKAPASDDVRWKRSVDGETYTQEGFNEYCDEQIPELNPSHARAAPTSDLRAARAHVHVHDAAVGS